MPIAAREESRHDPQEPALRMPLVQLSRTSGAERAQGDDWLAIEGRCQVRYGLGS